MSSYQTKGEVFEAFYIRIVCSCLYFQIMLMTESNYETKTREKVEGAFEVTY